MNKLTQKPRKDKFGVFLLSFGIKIVFTLPKPK